MLGVGDHSPEFQIADAPAFMYDANHNFLDPTYQQFAAYTQDLVSITTSREDFRRRMDNTFRQRDCQITWWGIYNEPNFNNSEPIAYTQLYNAVVPAMQAVDPSLKYAAVELGDYSGLANYLPAFVAGVTAHVDVWLRISILRAISKTPTRNFSDGSRFCQPKWRHLYAAKDESALTTVPVWVTENNVNADYAAGNGIERVQSGTQVFVDDLRGSSPFFAAWRPYVFSQLGKRACRLSITGISARTSNMGKSTTTRMRYSSAIGSTTGWERCFRQARDHSCCSTSTDDTDLETLAVINSDNSVVVMVANHAVNASTDNNGPGVSKTVAVDVSALGQFSSGSLLTIDKNTSVTNGPAASSVAPAAQMTLTLNGYSVGFLTLKP